MDGAGARLIEPDGLPVPLYGAEDVYPRAAPEQATACLRHRSAAWRAAVPAGPPVRRRA
jgi:hypothetical protein